MANTILDVRNLRISFRTSNGKVQAVRGISFQLEKGETLAIVGESGSGKSVTARSLLGILAPNAIVEGGELIYDGMDLLKIDEDDFHDVRGEKISMIFQDPLSSLNPIVKVGKQLTEAMIIKGKVKQKKARAAFNAMLKKVNEHMDLSVNAIENPQIKAAHKLKCENFDKFEYKHTELELAYNVAVEALNEAQVEIEDLLFKIEKRAVKELKRTSASIISLCEKAVHEYVIKDKADSLFGICRELASRAEKVVGEIKRIKKDGKGDIAAIDYSKVLECLNALSEILKEAKQFVKPNFFAMGYFLTFSNQSLPKLRVEELNAFLRKYLDDNFMLDFIADTKKAVVYSYTKTFAAKQEAVKELKKAAKLFESLPEDTSEGTTVLKRLYEMTKACYNPLSTHKDSVAETFESSLGDAVDFGYMRLKKNAKEKERFDAEKAKFDALCAAGKFPDWKVVPADIVDLNVIKENIQTVLNRLIVDFQTALSPDQVDFDEKTLNVIDYLKNKASDCVYKVTKNMAKNRALKLMEEVGIQEARTRYNQYPFQFSGGMRQRIVIAIALAADPEILVCDEPTTALDVTIQSQILELINRLKKERGISIIFITHDLGVVANMADKIAVMYAGKIVEYGTTEDVFYSPSHPYTWALLSSMPDLDTSEKLEAIPGTPPNMIYPPEGDAYAPRNKYAMKIDYERQPPFFQVGENHFAATWLLHPDAPKVLPPKIVLERINRMRALSEATETAAKAEEATFDGGKK